MDYPRNSAPLVGAPGAAPLLAVAQRQLGARQLRYARIAVALGEDVRGLSTLEAARRGVAAIAALTRDLEFPPFREFTGASPADIPRLAKMAEADPQTVGNPRLIDARGYEKIYTSIHGTGHPRAFPLE